MPIVEAEFVDLQRVHPFMKWAGRKGQLLSELDKLIPGEFNSYHEPLLGAGAMFFYLVSRSMKFNAYLSDTNVELITAYKVLKVNPKGVIELLRRYEHEYKQYPPYSKQQRECYYRLREARNKIRSSTDVEIAARLIALNKTCYNGLYRVNKKGKFNVPVGKYKNPLICDSSNLENVSSALSRATIFAGDYVDVIKNAQKGDFVYLDPPYDPVSYTSDFTAYTPDGFGRENQEQLANIFRKLADRGCFVLLSNSNTPFIMELYSHFRIKEVDVQRAINFFSFLLFYLYTR
jgi:DNA adenine methylase